MRGKSVKFWWITGGTAAAVLFLFLGAIFYGAYFASHALPRVTVAGESVTGETEQSLTELLTERADGVTVDVSFEGERSDVSPSELGYAVDVEQTVRDVFALNDSWATRISALFKPHSVPVVVTANPEPAEAYADELIAKVGARASDATVVFDEQQDQFIATPAVVGHDLDTTLLAGAAQIAAEELRSTEVSLTPVEVTPKVTDEQAQAAVEAANAIYAVPVSVTDGISIYTPAAPEKAGWVKVAAKDGVLAPPEVDDAKVAEWVKTTGESTNEEPLPGTRNVNSKGDVVSISNEGAPGWVVKDTAPVAAELVTALSNGEAFEGTFDYDRVENDKWEDRAIAEGAENLAYQAAAGEKWIDINLENYLVTAYEGSTVVQGPIAMVPGAPLTPTVTGQYAIYMKLPSQTMRGLNVDGTTYETPDVPSVMYFYEGYALHGAYWRDSFGYGGPGGSHGCVNMPLDSAQWFYDWSEIGTVVVSHF